MYTRSVAQMDRGVPLRMVANEHLARFTYTEHLAVQNTQSRRNSFVVGTCLSNRIRRQFHPTENWFAYFRSLSGVGFQISFHLLLAKRADRNSSRWMFLEASSEDGEDRPLSEGVSRTWPPGLCKS